MQLSLQINGSNHKTCAEGYRFGFNGKEKDDETYDTGNAYDFGARIYDSRLGRWLSVDPLQQKYPGFSPYNFASNSPISIIDYDGRENVIYLIVLPDASGPVKQNAQSIANSANKNFEALDIKTRVIVFESKGPLPPSFDVKNMDKTDAVAIIGGSKKSVEKFVEKINPKSEQFKNWLSPPPNPAKTSENTNINPERTDIKIGLDGSELETFAEDIKHTPASAAGVLILHGAGHIGGNPNHHPLTPLLDHSGPEMKALVQNQGRSLTSVQENEGFAERLKKPENFGDKDYKDNYNKNSMENRIKNGNIRIPFKPN
jgi:RHS repeat-associated protein